MNQIVLFWQRACGKTTIGRELGNQTERKFVDLDEIIVKKLWMSISDFVKQEGENGWYKFRLAEQEALREVLWNQENQIISLGGGTIAFSEVKSSIGKINPEKNQKRLYESWAKRIFLHAQPEVLAARIEGDNAGNLNRPALAKWQETPLQESIRIYKERVAIYMAQSDELIEVWWISVPEIVDKILRLYPKIAA